jgi:hypothetical protein
MMEICTTREEWRERGRGDGEVEEGKTPLGNLEWETHLLLDLGAHVLLLDLLLVQDLDGHLRARGREGRR